MRKNECAMDTLARKKMDYAIIGAGLTGLTLGWDLLQKFPHLKVQIFEKSSGCGGRLATRRIGNLTYDHGAQFIKKNKISERWIEIAEKAGSMIPFTDENSFCSRFGMNRFAKIFANRLPVIYNHKITSLSSKEGFWILKNNEGFDYLSKNIIFTSPLPQSLEILKNSGINFDLSLYDIEYSCALVVMVEKIQHKINETDFESIVYQERIGSGIFSICSQYLKGTSQAPCWTIVMDEYWSKFHFEMQEKKILKEASFLLKKIIPALRLKNAHLKKWKYCQPSKIWPQLFENPTPHLYLAGDAFGGASLLGSLRSSQALFEHLQLERNEF